MAVCEHCNDTHRMDLGERLGVVLCTHCPRPCQTCGGGGPYCKTTPCGCPCHTARPWWPTGPLVTTTGLHRVTTHRGPVPEVVDKAAGPVPYQEALDVAAAEPRAGIFWPAVCLEPRIEEALLQFWYRVSLTPSGEPPERSIFWVQAADGERFKITIEPVNKPPITQPAATAPHLGVKDAAIGDEHETIVLPQKD